MPKKVAIRFLSIPCVPRFLDLLSFGLSMSCKHSRRRRTLVLWCPTCDTSRGMRNALTVDLEEYFHVRAFADRVKPEDWDSMESRVEQNTEKVLVLLEETGHRATFFTVGWLAEKYPKLIAHIAESGHEIACHSHLHRPVHALTRATFREDTQRAKNALEQAIGQPVYGYRAPSFSITNHSLWAFEVLTELGFTYDSSVFPVRHPDYGMPDAPRFPFLVETPSGPIFEFPMATIEWQGRRSPFGGGAYLRLLPLRYTHWAIQSVNERERNPVCVYLHPWELDPLQPRMKGRLSSILRHYLGLRKMESKLRQILHAFEFAPLGICVSEFSDSVSSYSFVPHKA